MNTKQAEALIEEIITMPTPAHAAAYVETHLAEFREAAFLRVLSRMIKDAALPPAPVGTHQNETRRHRALMTLYSYLSTHSRQEAAQTFGVSNVQEALPILVVITAENAADILTDATESSFDKWFSLLKGIRATTEEVDAQAPLDDIAINRLQSKIDQGILMARAEGLRQGGARAQDIENLEQLLRDCDRLLRDARPKALPLDNDAINMKKADIVGIIAGVYDRMGEPIRAREHYRRAAVMYDELGQTQQSIRSRIAEAQVLFFSEGEMDEAITRVQHLLEKPPASPLDHAETLLNLGQMYYRAGDDFRAEEALQGMKEILDSRGHQKPPTDSDLEKTLHGFAQALLQESDMSQIVSLGQNLQDEQQIQNLYAQYYRICHDIYERRGDEAEARRHLDLMQQYER
jgi:tetratricopeptide (TPR) repeat protein